MSPSSVVRPPPPPPRRSAGDGVDGGCMQRRAGMDCGRGRRGREIWPVARPDPELTAAVQSHDPPRAKLYHIHSSRDPPFSPLLSPLCIPDPGRPHQTLPGVCLSVCPPACRAAMGGRGMKGVWHSSCKVHFLNSESRTWRESGETNERTDACSLKLHTLTGRLLNA